MPRPLGQILLGALGKLLYKANAGRSCNWAPYFSGSWLVLRPNSITQKVENLRSVNSIQVQVLGHHIYAITNLSSICCLHISLGHPLPWFLAAPQISLSIFSIVSLVLQPHLTTLLLSGTNHDLFLIWWHKLSCVLDESVLISVHGISHSPWLLWYHFSSFPKHSPWFEAHTVELAIFPSMPYCCWYALLPF